MRKVWRIRRNAALIALLFGLAFGEPLGRFVRDQIAALMAVTISSPVPPPVTPSWAITPPPAPVWSSSVTIFTTHDYSLYTNATATGPLVFDLSGITLIGQQQMFMVTAPIPLTVRAPAGGKIGSEWSSSSPGSSMSIIHIGSGTWASKRGDMTGTWSHP